MYHASVLCVPNESLLAGSLYMMPLDPDDAMGWAFQSYLWPWRWWYTDFPALIQDVHSRFTVIIAYVARWSHNCTVVFADVVHSPLMKWFLNVWIAHSAVCYPVI